MVFPFINLSSVHTTTFTLLKYLFSITDDQGEYKNLGDTTVLVHKMFSSGCCPVVSKTRMLNSVTFCIYRSVGSFIKHLLSLMCQPVPHWLSKRNVSFVSVVAHLNNESKVRKQISSQYVHVQ